MRTTRVIEWSFGPVMLLVLGEFLVALVSVAAGVRNDRDVGTETAEA
jgi:hypothetical protein